VTFNPTQLGQSSTGTFTIQNSGNTPVSVISIYIANANSAFSVSGLPNLPVTLAAGASVSFTVVFTPTTTGSNSAVLNVDAASFNLVGPGTAPPSLPDFVIQTSGGGTGPLQQPSVGLSLAAPYALAVSGMLTITQNPQVFNPDPSVVFSTGGASVAFTIPANSTQAVFPNGATSVRLQTGSVANTITVTPSFATASGYNLTPANVHTVQFVVPSSAPQLSAVNITQTSQSGFTLQVTGVVTSLALTSLEFDFTAVSGFNLSSSKVVVNVSSTAAAWFQSSSSTSFGGQFFVTVPFSLASSVTSTTSSLTAIQSVTVTATNPLGTSNGVSTQFQ
jgi:hypothetical protein